MIWVWVIIAILSISSTLIMLIYTNKIAKSVYKSLLTRKEGLRERVCSAPDNEEQVKMWNDGLLWAKENQKYKKDLKIKSEDLTLYGEYYDFGFDKCAVILPGRSECLIYSYYFSSPYKESGCNVLCIDSRSTGLSDGNYNTLGTKESIDIINWIKHLENSFDIHQFYLHSICVGTSGALIALNSKDCPRAIKALVSDGCYTSFRETFKRHMIEDHRPLFPVLDLVMLHIKLNTGAKIIKDSPLRLVKKINIPVLFLFSKQDKFSIPQKSKILFDACASNNKKLVWFDKGAHSHIRVNNTEKYDSTIKKFVKEVSAS